MTKKYLCDNSLDKHRSQQKARNKVKDLEKTLRDHLDNNNVLRRNYNREEPGQGITNKKLKIHEETLKLKAENDSIDNIRKDIIDGKYNLTLNKESYEKHIEGHKRYENYVNRLKEKGSPHIPSSLSISYEEAQELIKKYAGSGKIIVNKGQVKEFIKSNNKVVGVYRDIPNGIEEETTNFVIHYSKSIKKGTHIVPSWEDKNV